MSEITIKDAVKSMKEGVGFLIIRNPVKRNQKAIEYFEDPVKRNQKAIEYFEVRE
jgi:hypothetical protein